MHEWKLVTIIDLEVPPQKLLMGALLLQIWSLPTCKNDRISQFQKHHTKIYHLVVENNCYIINVALHFFVLSNK
jgi:hypothetical protein